MKNKKQIIQSIILLTLFVYGVVYFVSKHNKQYNNYIVSYKVYYPNRIQDESFICYNCRNIRQISVNGTNMIRYNKIENKGPQFIITTTLPIELTSINVITLIELSNK